MYQMYFRTHKKKDTHLTQGNLYKKGSKQKKTPFQPFYSMLKCKHPRQYTLNRKNINFLCQDKA